jgi:hypothetical protein
LQLSLDLPGAAGYPGFRATVRDVDKGGIVWQGTCRKRGASGHWLVALTLDPRLLAGGGDFIIGLEGVTASGALERLPSFTFELRRR